VFDNNGVIVGSMAHATATSTINIGSAGNYAVWFYAEAAEPSQFTLLQNGSAVEGAIYGWGSGSLGRTGMVIITAVTGDVLTVRNHSSYRHLREALSQIQMLRY
jgi:hypothetical protein